MTRFSKLALLLPVAAGVWAQVPRLKNGPAKPALVLLSVRDAHTEVPFVSRSRVRDAPQESRVLDWTIVVAAVNSWDGLLSSAVHEPLLFVDREPCGLKFVRDRLICVVPLVADTSKAVLWRPASDWESGSGVPPATELDALKAAAEKGGRAFPIATAARRVSFAASDRSALFKTSPE